MLFALLTPVAVISSFCTSETYKTSICIFNLLSRRPRNGIVRRWGGTFTKWKLHGDSASLFDRTCM